MALNLNRTFGVEIELIGVASAIKDAIEQQGLSCTIEGYNHTTRSHWKIVSDSSVRANRGQAGNGMELVSPILKGQDGLDQIRKIGEALRIAGAQVNMSCGLHVHHDARDFKTETFKNLFKIYKRFESTIDQLVAPSRRENNNTYCKSLQWISAEAIDSYTASDAMIRYIGSRYYKLNFRSYITHGTVEFRQHQGTVNAEKIINWIMLTQAMVQRAVERRVGKTTKNDWETFKYFLFLNPDKNHRVSSYDEETKAMLKYFSNRKKELATVA